VLLNLVRNAIEAMEEVDRRELLITTRRLGDKVEIAVADTGQGIPAELADRLFQPFVTTKKSGLGLGLSICREIVKAHEGELTVAPRSSGGAVFRVVLPIAPEERGDDAG
jgi:two-component system sensor kinase FixL